MKYDGSHVVGAFVISYVCGYLFLLLVTTLGNLHISNVQSNDYRNGKTYYCAVQNQLLNNLASGEDQLVNPLEGICS